MPLIHTLGAPEETGMCSCTPLVSAVPGLAHRGQALATSFEMFCSSQRSHERRPLNCSRLSSRIFLLLSSISLARVSTLCTAPFSSSIARSRFCSIQVARRRWQDRQRGSTTAREGPRSAPGVSPGSVRVRCWWVPKPFCSLCSAKLAAKKMFYRCECTTAI